jgi:AAA+ superfamily predicted ATPase
MLKRDYGPGVGSEFDQADAVSSERQLARIWAARLLEAMGRPNCLLRFDDTVLNELGLLDDSGPHGQAKELFKNRAKIRAVRLKLESESWRNRGVLNDNLRFLAKRFDFDERDCAVLAFLALAARFDWFSSLIDDAIARGNLDGFAACVAVATGLSFEQIGEAVAHDGRLFASGLIRASHLSSLGAADQPALAVEISAGLWCRDFRDGFLERRMVESINPAEAARLDSADLPVAFRTLHAMVRAMLDQQVPCGQVLVHGKPGTGKTRFVHALAADLEARAYAIRDSRRNRQLNAAERIESFAIAQTLLRDQDRCLLVFDECDRELALSTRSTWQQSNDWNKAWLNRLIETASIPGVWIANELDGVHPSTLRRFAMVAEMPALPQKTRTAVLRRTLDGLPVEAEWIEAVSKAPSLTPALMKNAASVGRGLHAVSGLSLEEAMTETLVGHCQAAGLDFVPPTRSSRKRIKLPYSSTWLNTTPDIRIVLKGLGRADSTSGRLLLHGPPGTGKTRLAREIADRIERPLQVLAASDLLDPYLGNTEKNIRRAFDDARKQRTVLLLDEIDGLLMDRARAIRSWEVTQINELLTRIDHFDGLLVGTTNRHEALDPAVLRRFDLKIGFGYLQSQQAIELMQAVLGDDRQLNPLERRRLAALDRLTPGDFRTAVRQLEIQGKSVTAAALIDALAEEVKLKSGTERRPIGFTASL